MTDEEKRRRMEAFNEVMEDELRRLTEESWVGRAIEICGAWAQITTHFENRTFKKEGE